MDGPVQATVDGAVAALVAAAAVRSPDMAALSAEVDAHNVKVAALAAGKGRGMFYTLRVGMLASERAAITAKMAALAGVEIDAHNIKVTALNAVAEGLPLPRLEG